MGMVHSGFYGALFNGDEEQGRLFDDLVGSIRSADEGKAKAIYLTGSRKPTFSACIAQSDVLHVGTMVPVTAACSPLLCGQDQLGLLAVAAAGPVHRPIRRPESSQAVRMPALRAGLTLAMSCGFRALSGSSAVPALCC